ncbi:TonB family protein [bacterium]|nr:TonB family protein [bacterium]MBU1994075.1 TonB family protein [bacterium]
MNRYLSSFIISASIYFAVMATLFYFITNNSCSADSKMEDTKIMKISLLNLEKRMIAPVQKPEVKHSLKPKAKIIQKIKPKPLVKNIPLVGPKSIPLVHPVPKETKEEVKQEPILEQAVFEDSAVYISQPNKQNTSNMQNNKLAAKELENKQIEFFTKLKELINKNKSYPNSARRRAIQGDVEVRFYLLEDGNVKNIELLSGKSIFEKSVQQAIEKSFPVKIDKELFNFPKEFKITIAYILK